MKARNKLLIGILIAALALSIVPATSFAQGGPGNDQPGHHQVFPFKELITRLNEAAAQTLNMTLDDFLQALRQGKTPEELIQQQKVDKGALETALEQVWHDEGKRVIDQFITEGPPPGRAPLAKFGRRLANSRQWLHILADELGMTPTELRKALRSGQTLEEIIQAHGKTMQEVIDAIIAAKKARLDEAVADGKMTQEQADAILNRFSKEVSNWTEKGGILAGKRPGKIVRTSALWTQTAARTLDMPVSDFIKALREGQTPAQIAEAHGSSGQELIDAIIAAQKARLEKAVSAGNMTQERMDSILSRLTRSINKWVEKGLPGPKPKH